MANDKHNHPINDGAEIVIRAKVAGSLGAPSDNRIAVVTPDGTRFMLNGNQVEVHRAMEETKQVIGEDAKITAAEAKKVGRKVLDKIESAVKKADTDDKA